MTYVLRSPYCLFGESKMYHSQLPQKCGNCNNEGARFRNYVILWLTIKFFEFPLTEMEHINSTAVSWKVSCIADLDEKRQGQIFKSFQFTSMAGEWKFDLFFKSFSCILILISFMKLTIRSFIHSNIYLSFTNSIAVIFLIFTIFAKLY